MKNIHLEETEQRFAKTVSLLHEQFLLIGYSTLNAVDNLKVEYYGSKTPLSQVSTITSPYNGKAVISPYDKSLTDDIVRVIQNASLGVGVYKDNGKVVVTAPRITTQQREQLCDHISKLGEESKVAIRNIRRDVRKVLDRAELPEDDLRKANDKLQEMTDKYIRMVDDEVKRKQNKLME